MYSERERESTWKVESWSAREDVNEGLQLLVLNGDKLERLNPKTLGGLERIRWGRLRWGLRATTRVLWNCGFWVFEGGVEAE